MRSLLRRAKIPESPEILGCPLNGYSGFMSRGSMSCTDDNDDDNSSQYETYYPWNFGVYTKGRQMELLHL